MLRTDVVLLSARSNRRNENDYRIRMLVGSWVVPETLGGADASHRRTDFVFYNYGVMMYTDGVQEGGGNFLARVAPPPQPPSGVCPAAPLRRKARGEGKRLQFAKDESKPELSIMAGNYYCSPFSVLSVLRRSSRLFYWIVHSSPVRNETASVPKTSPASGPK